MTDVVDDDEIDPLEHCLELLDQLRTHEKALDGIASDAARVEVEALAADVAVKTGLGKSQPNISPSKAAEVIGLLRRVRARDNEASPPPAVSSQERGQLDVASRALRDWLEAPSLSTGPQTTHLVARSIVLVLVVGVLWASVQVHAAFLLLIPPIAVPLSILLRSGDDVRWRRVGAKRNFDRTGLAPPAEWKAEAVTARAEELEAALAQIEPAAVNLPRPNEDRHVSGEAVEDMHDLSVALGDRHDGTAFGDALGDRHAVTDGHEDAPDGQDPVDQLIDAVARLRLAGGRSGYDIAPDVEVWLETLSTAYRAKQTLESLQRKRGVALEGASEARETIFRFLARRGEAPPDGAASADALESGLRRVQGKPLH